MMALRLSEGADLKLFSKIIGATLDQKRIDHLADLGLVDWVGTHLRATQAGRPLLNGILRDLLA